MGLSKDGQCHSNVLLDANNQMVGLITHKKKQIEKLIISANLPKFNR